MCRCLALYRPLLHFFRALIQPEYSAVTDVYVLMFLADTVDFIIIVFGFWAFGVRRGPPGPAPVHLLTSLPLSPRNTRPPLTSLPLYQKTKFLRPSWSWF